MAEERRAKGLYWDAAWKAVEGCTKVSPGCDNCWSEQETAMRCGHPNLKIADRAHNVMGGMDAKKFDGSILLREDNLYLPLRTKKPTVFAVWNDLFHEDVPDEFIDKAFDAMGDRYCGHTFLVLTKRAQRLADYMTAERWGGLHPGEPHIWFGVTAENQQAAAERIPFLLQVPGKRFLSIEPMLGPVDLSAWMNGHYMVQGSFNLGISAVLLGGESGRLARPMHPDWVRSVRDRCRDAGVAFFFKQWGEFHPLMWFDGGDVCIGHDKGYRTAELDGATMVRCGRRAAGRHLDGVLHDALPWEVATK